ncbi:hypothetical protein, partial [Tenacibaculum maritimum]|uniref:hypothetical protein n=1 Tax=Tenacibaculum maritimum TaxID=107401 RepID=UPI001F235F92
DLKCRRQASSLSKCAVKLKIFMVIFYSKIRLFIQLWMITDIQFFFKEIDCPSNDEAIINKISTSMFLFVFKILFFILVKY